MNVRLRADVSSDNVDVPDLLEACVGNDDRATRRKLAKVLDRVHVEVNLIRNSEPHVILGPARLTLDVEIVIDVDVVGRAVAAACSTPKRKGRNQIVVNR